MRGVTGGADIESSYDAVEITRVTGDVRVKVEHGKVSVREVTGSLTAATTHDDVVLEDVAGPAEVTVSHGGVRAQRLQKGVKREGFAATTSSSRECRVPMDVDLERGSVHVAQHGPLTEAITVRSTNGGIRLEVPSGSRFDLEAEARRGDVEVDVPGLSLTRTEKRRAHGSVGGGGRLVKLSADGDVIVEERAATAAGEL